ncbi:FAD-binding oxidoreductase [Synechococcus elongatus]|uniref:FAD-binding oxidoreductase n=1 Tax=Synechococcus elongatus PCC 11801 TaxID=2219813 RepID=A0AAN1UTB5_SYNEL|nr:FAD-binding oxidoreductase [Synechococcus elongatus]AZB71339.1 FAD-linked oxidase [Synechococcus elongatus PCC 11801]
MVDWTAVDHALAGIESDRDRATCQRLSLDYAHFSPILWPQLQDRAADRVLYPHTKADLLAIARVCVQEQIPLTVRGAATGNYGQCTPLQGGILVDLTAFDQIVWQRGSRLRVQAGAKLAAIDRAIRPSGWELRWAPSTYRTATIGGFFAGGSGGIGSITYGQLRDRGNLLGAQVLTLEAEPRFVELQGEAAQAINHAYGCTGLITELEIPLAPAYDWQECMVNFPSWSGALSFAQAIAEADGLIKKMVCVLANPIPSFCKAIKDACHAGETAVLLLLSESSLEVATAIASEIGGRISWQRSPQDQPLTTLIEQSWNHTTLHARSADPAWTYLQMLLPLGQEAALIDAFQSRWGDSVLWHLELLRSHGQVRVAALPLVRFEGRDRLQQLTDQLTAAGAILFDPHTYCLEDGGMKQIDVQQLTFKEQIDPQGLFNPGKMRAWSEKYGDRSAVT